MITAEITKDQKLIDTVFIPENESEIKYSQFIEFSLRADSMYDWITEQRQQEKTYQYQLTTKIAECVSSVLNVDKSILLNLKLNEQNWLWSAWEIINGIIKDYKPEAKGIFRLNGKWYKVPELTESIITKNIYTDNMTFEQVQECAYIEKKLSDVLSAIKRNELKDSTDVQDQKRAEVIYTYTLMKIAVCINDPNEIPDTFDKWLDEKVIEIQDISMKDALNTIFFLTSLSINYNVLTELNTTLKKFQLDDTQMKILKPIQTD